MWKQIAMVPGCHPDWITSQPSFSCPMTDRQNCILKGQAKHRWCLFSISIKLCNQLIMHNDTIWPSS